MYEEDDVQLEPLEGYEPSAYADDEDDVRYPPADDADDDGEDDPDEIDFGDDPYGLFAGHDDE